MSNYRNDEGWEGRRPLVVAVLDGGLIQDDYIFPGVGEPDFEFIDYDREGEDPKARNEWCDYMVTLADRMHYTYGLSEEFWKGLLEEINSMRLDDD